MRLVDTFTIKSEKFMQLASEQLITVKATKDDMVVVQDNALVSACYKLNLNAKRLLVMAIGRLDSTSDDWKLDNDEVEGFEISADDWCKTWDIDRRNGMKTLRDAATELWEASIYSGDYKRGEEFRFLARRAWDENKKNVRVAFTKDIRNLATGLTQEFTKYALLNVKAMKSNYAIRLYELSRQFSKLGRRTIAVDDMRDLLGVGKDQYPKFGEFNKWVLQRAAKEASLKGDLDIEIETVRKGRAVTAVTLVITPKQQGDFGF